MDIISIASNIYRDKKKKLKTHNDNKNTHKTISIYGDVRHLTHTQNNQYLWRCTPLNTHKTISIYGNVRHLTHTKQSVFMAMYAT